MDRFNLSQIILQLAGGLEDDAHKDRLAQGITAIYESTPEGFNENLYRNISMPLFSRSIYSSNRFDIPVSEYVGHLQDIVVETFEPHGPKMVLRKSKTELKYNSYQDEEAAYMEDLASRFFSYIDTILPHSR